MLIMLTVGLHI